MTNSEDGSICKAVFSGSKSGSWRVSVLAEAERIKQDVIDTTGADAVKSLLKQAKDVATYNIAGSGNLWLSLRDWWNGTSIESAWQDLQLAQEKLVMLQDVATIKAQVPHFKSLAERTYGVTRAKEVAKALDSEQPDPYLAKQVLVAYHTHSNATHQAVRSLRHLYLILTVLIGIADVTLVVTKVTSGAVVGLGALGGALSVVFALQSSKSNSPYNVLLAQAFLKMVSGSATGLMAVVLLAYGDTSLTPNSIKARVYAVAFGFSQQAFTQLADKRAGVVNSATEQRSAHTAKSAPG